MNILIKGGTILPMNREDGDRLYFTGSVGIVGERIVMVSDDKSQEERFLSEHSDATVIDARGKVVMPGLINTHTHVAMAILRGVADDMPLMEWLNDHIWPIEGRMAYKDVYDGSRLGMLEMLLGGTTTMVDMYPYNEAVAEAAESAGIRAVVSPCSMDFRMAHFEQDWRNIHNRFRNSRTVSMIMGPHAIYTLSEENLKRTIQLAEELDCMYHIHVSETQGEVDDCMKAHGMSPVEYLEKQGLFDRRVLAAHCVVMSDHDIEILARHGASVAHNPQSNMKLASGIAPVKKMIDAGVNVALGTDGASSNNDLDMWEEMRTASLLQKVSTGDPCAVPAYSALKMATVNGAKAIGREGELGVIAEGALADIILVDIEKPHMYPHTNLVSELVYSSNAADVETVIVNGQIVVEGRKCLTMDEKEVCGTAQHDIDLLISE
ncbi:MAG: amidohydrolase [Bacteroidaceae bacterium]|nr:amidohydrolase [Bacteroidaceae bacterium]